MKVPILLLSAYSIASLQAMELELPPRRHEQMYPVMAHAIELLAQLNTVSYSSDNNHFYINKVKASLSQPYEVYIRFRIPFPEDDLDHIKGLVFHKDPLKDAEIKKFIHFVIDDYLHTEEKTSSKRYSNNGRAEYNAYLDGATEHKKIINGILTLPIQTDQDQAHESKRSTMLSLVPSVHLVQPPYHSSSPFLPKIIKSKLDKISQVKVADDFKQKISSIINNKVEKIKSLKKGKD